MQFHEKQNFYNAKESIMRNMWLSTKQLVLMTIISLIIMGSYYWLIWTDGHLRKVGIGITMKPIVKQRTGNSNSLTSTGGGSDYDEHLVVLYNRVPKTGSTTFVNIAYDLCRKNKFHVLHINVTANMHVLSIPNQVSFVRNVTNWQQMKPALYHGHLAFLDFSKFQIPVKPIYINLIRKPLDRLVSYYYFLRFGDNYRPNLVRKKAGNKITFDDCVKLKQADCDAKNMWLQIPFFCGHSAECWEPGSDWALAQAKRNLVNEYFLVGVTEQMDNFIMLLERSLPRIFHGFHDYYHNSNKSHLRQTTSKIIPNEDTVTEIKKSRIWQMENDLYEFAVMQFDFNKRKLTVSDNEHLQTFTYEKIRPK